MQKIMTEKERMLSEKLYIPMDEALAADCARSRRLVRLINGTTEEKAEYRVCLLYTSGKKQKDTACAQLCASHALSHLCGELYRSIYASGQCRRIRHPWNPSSPHVILFTAYYIG